MTDYMAQMLDELMGPSRNAVAGESKMTYDHRDVCKHFLAGFCPNELFRNTKADLGTCSLRHDERLKLEYQNSSRFGKMGYEENFIERIRSLDREVKRRIEKNMQRLESDLKNYDGEASTKQADDEKVTELMEQIEETLAEAQRLCESGNVTAGEALIRQSEALEQQRKVMLIDKQEQQRRIEATAQELNKPMHVCQVCGCFMLINDAQARIDDHLMGKMHITYQRIRTTIEDWDKKKEEERKKQHEEREKRHQEKKAKEKEERREKDKDKEERREKDKDRKKRSRSRSRDRKRSHSRDRFRRDSRDHHRSSHHRHSDRSERKHSRKHD
ncbi:unnamed protein product, partial [Mesorhabditis belari]|uniref:Luc7-like protein 3 n=1 Tax=Mesorhabditis belari TaxID=2138241 RepID=A0AAF3E8C8_9BILA